MHKYHSILQYIVSLAPYCDAYRINRFMQNEYWVPMGTEPQVAYLNPVDKSQTQVGLVAVRLGKITAKEYSKLFRKEQNFFPPFRMSSIIIFERIPTGNKRCSPVINLFHRVW